MRASHPSLLSRRLSKCHATLLSRERCVTSRKNQVILDWRRMARPFFSPYEISQSKTKRFTREKELNSVIVFQYK